MHLQHPHQIKSYPFGRIRTKKTYALIVASISEDVSRHIIPITNSYDALEKLKYLCELLSKLEVVQLMIKLFNLEL